MPKAIKKPYPRIPPRFLQRRLDAKMLTFIRNEQHAFLETIKKTRKGEYPPAINLLEKFFAHLAKKDPKNFKGITHDMIRTKDPGTYQIYDSLRKKVERLEEKKASANSTPPKEQHSISIKEISELQDP